jgi:hypothetical protein
MARAPIPESSTVVVPLPVNGSSAPVARARCGRRVTRTRLTWSAVPTSAGAPMSTSGGTSALVTGLVGGGVVVEVVVLVDVEVLVEVDVLVLAVVEVLAAGSTIAGTGSEGVSCPVPAGTSGSAPATRGASVTPSTIPMDSNAARVPKRRSGWAWTTEPPSGPGDAGAPALGARFCTG